MSFSASREGAGMGSSEYQAYGGTNQPQSSSAPYYGGGSQTTSGSTFGGAGSSGFGGGASSSQQRPYLSASGPMPLGAQQSYSSDQPYQPQAGSFSSSQGFSGSGLGSQGTGYSRPLTTGTVTTFASSEDHGRILREPSREIPLGQQQQQQQPYMATSSGFGQQSQAENVPGSNVKFPSQNWKQRGVSTASPITGGDMHRWCAEKVCIEEVLARYYYFFDTQQAGAWVNLWAQNGEFCSDRIRACGKDELYRMVQNHFVHSRGSRHLLGNPIIEVHSESHASVNSLMVLFDGLRPPAKVIATALCTWELCKENGDWRIVRHSFNLDPSWQC